jgi:hypothetical protein
LRSFQQLLAGSVTPEDAAVQLWSLADAHYDRREFEKLTEFRELAISLSLAEDPDCEFELDLDQWRADVLALAYEALAAWGRDGDGPRFHARGERQPRAGDRARRCRSQRPSARRWPIVRTYQLAAAGGPRDSFQNRRRLSPDMSSPRLRVQLEAAGPPPTEGRPQISGRAAPASPDNHTRFPGRYQERRLVDD